MEDRCILSDTYAYFFVFKGSKNISVPGLGGEGTLLNFFCWVSQSLEITALSRHFKVQDVEQKTLPFLTYLRSRPVKNKLDLLWQASYQ